MILQAIMSGLAMGSIYALVGLGYYITYVTTGVVNFGQGAFLALGALLGLSLVLTYHLPFLLMVVVVLAVMGLVGLLLERLAIRPVRKAMSIGWIMSTTGIGIALENSLMLVWGRQPSPFPPVFSNSSMSFGGLYVSPEQLFVIVVALTVSFGMYLFLNKAPLGKALRAVALNESAAKVVGINVKFVVGFAFIISSMLAGLGGVLIAPITFAGPFMGDLLGIKAFASAIIGGIDNPAGIMAGGLMLGVTEALVRLWSTTWSNFAVMALILLLLVIKPSGFWGGKTIEKY